MSIPACASRWSSSLPGSLRGHRLVQPVAELPMPLPVSPHEHPAHAVSNLTHPADIDVVKCQRYQYYQRFRFSLKGLL